MTNKLPPGFVTRTEAAQLLGCHPATVKRHVKAGHYPDAIPPDESPAGCWLIPIDDLSPHEPGHAVHPGRLHATQPLDAVDAAAVGALVIDLVRALAGGVR